MNVVGQKQQPVPGLHCVLPLTLPTIRAWHSAQSARDGKPERLMRIYRPEPITPCLMFKKPPDKNIYPL